jgi:hypothetical protein
MNRGKFDIGRESIEESLTRSTKNALSGHSLKRRPGEASGWVLRHLVDHRPDLDAPARGAVPPGVQEP